MVSVIISYSTRDRNGLKYSKKLVEDLKVYGVDVCADIPNCRPPTFINGKPWIDSFSDLMPKQDYYILVVTESFESSNALKEFEKFKDCPNICTGVCGKRQEDGCNLKAIIPCFFIDPSKTSKVNVIAGIREFKESYEVGFMELIKKLFPEPKYMEPKEISEVIKFCKLLEEKIYDILDKYETIFKLSILNIERGKNGKEHIEVINMLIDKFIKNELEEIKKMYKHSPDCVKRLLDIRLIKLLESTTNEITDLICAETKTDKFMELFMENIINPIDNVARKVISDLNECIKQAASTIVSKLGYSGEGYV